MDSFEEYDLPPALPIMGMIDHSQETQYALGTQKKDVQGEVLKWHHELGTVSVPAAEYIERLENENRILKQQVGQSFLCRKFVSRTVVKFTKSSVLLQLMLYMLTPCLSPPASDSSVTFKPTQHCTIAAYLAKGLSFHIPH